jgi:cyclase
MERARGWWRSLRTLLVGLAAGVLAPAPARAVAPPAAAHYEIVRVAEGIWSFIPAESKSAIVSGNTTAIVGDDGVLVFDTGNFPSVAPAIIADLRRLTDKKVRYVVNSHWHFDHCNGNAAFRKAFPDAVFVASSFTRERMAANFQKFDASSPPLLESEVKRIRGLLGTGKRPDGSPLSQPARAAYEAILSDYEGAIPEYARVELVLADATFDDAMTIHLGRREVLLRHLGRGNTAGDVVVYVPDARVLVSGDVLVLPVPYGFGSYPTEWADVLKKIDAMDTTAIVPGHGPVQHDHAYLRALESALESVTAQVRPLVSRGEGLEKIQKTVNLDAFRKELSAGSPERERAFDQFFLSSIVARAYEEARGSFTPEGAG